MIASVFARLAAVCCLVFAALPSVAALNGLWSSSKGDYLLLLQDASSGATFAIQVPASLDALRVWTGSGSPASIHLQGLQSAADQLAASVNGNTMSGSLTQGGVQSAFNASLALAWVANDNAGVWQKAAAANAYLVFCVLETGNGRLGLQIDVTINADKSYAYDIFTGAINGSIFNGASITGSGLLSRMEFGAGTLAGSYTTVARPVKVTAFTAQQIVKIGG